MLHQMVDIVREQRPDVFLLCGDIYHSAQPSAAVQKMLSDAIVDIHNAHPEMTIVLTAGNHDSGSKHDIFRTPWRALGVYTVGNLEKDSLEDHIIEVPGRGYIVAVPYANERNIPEGFFQSLLDLTAERNTEGLPVVMMAHTTVRGCDYTGHDQIISHAAAAVQSTGATATQNTGAAAAVQSTATAETPDYIVGGIDALDVAQMGEGYDYLALGHIHHEQFVHTGHHNVRYCGSPLAVSFDESYAHSVSIVEIDRHGDTPKVSTKEITNPHPLVSLPVEGYTSWEQAKELLSAYPGDIPAYIRLNVEVDDFLQTGADSEAQALTEGKRCRFCHINVRRRAGAQSEAPHTLCVQELQSEQPLEFVRRYANDIGVAFDEELQQLFDQALQQLNDDMRS